MNRNNRANNGEPLPLDEGARILIIGATLLDTYRSTETKLKNKKYPKLFVSSCFVTGVEQQMAFGDSGMNNPADEKVARINGDREREDRDKLQRKRQQDQDTIM